LLNLKGNIMLHTPQLSLGQTKTPATLAGTLKSAAAWLLVLAVGGYYAIKLLLFLLLLALLLTPPLAASAASTHSGMPWLEDSHIPHESSPMSGVARPTLGKWLR
jgi:hypothetical protein